jgi:hypothetical protein
VFTSAGVKSVVEARTEPRMNTGAAQPAGQSASAQANREEAKGRPAFNHRDRRPVAPSHSRDRASPVTAFRPTTLLDRHQRAIEQVRTGVPMPLLAVAPA